MLRGIGDAKAYHHFVDERGLRLCRSQRVEVRSGAEHDLVASDGEALPFEQWSIAASIGVGDHVTQQPASLTTRRIQRVQAHAHAAGRAAVSSIEHVSGQSTQANVPPGGGLCHGSQSMSTIFVQIVYNLTS